MSPVDASNRADPSWAAIEPPYVVGYEAAGWIEEVGAGVAGFARGDAVWGVCPVRGTRWGTYAECAELDAGWVGRRPAVLDVDAAAVIPLAGSTALQLLDPERQTLDRHCEAVERGALRPVVDAVIEPDEIVATHRGLETGRGGKVVLRMTEADTFV